MEGIVVDVGKGQRSNGDLNTAEYYAAGVGHGCTAAQRRRTANEVVRKIQVVVQRGRGKERVEGCG